VGGRHSFSYRFKYPSPLFICRIRRIAPGLADELPQDLFYVHTAQELDILTHQVLQNVFALRADRGQVPQIDNQFAAPKICSGCSAGAREFGGPRRCESALNDQSALARVLDNRDLQHAARMLNAGVQRTYQAFAAVTACFSM
jgi:hypothetical protein